MIKKIILVGVALVGLLSVLFYFLTLPMSVTVETDGNYNKAKDTDLKRPFHVDRNEYPFASHWVEYKGASMHYLDQGEGTPVVLCHGNPTWSFLYRNVIKGLDDQARMIAHDLPGMGFSGIPNGFDFRPESHSKYVEHFLLTELKLDKFIMVVQDWGGPTCLNIATQYPDKILGLVISNTWAWPAEGKLAQASSFLKTAPAQRIIINRNGLGDMMMDALLPEMDNREAILKAYSDAFPTPESRKPTAIFPSEITESKNWLADIDSRMSTLKDKPVQIILGLKDVSTTSEYTKNKWKSFFPDAEIQIIEEAHHFTQEDSPESFVIAIQRLLQIIGEVDPSGSDIQVE